MECSTAQKQQIRDSLQQALRHHTPKEWTLCIPVDMDEKTHRCFQRLAASRRNDTTVTLWQASDIVQQLIHYRSVCEAFFPNAI